MGVLNKKELLALAKNHELFINNDFIEKNFKSASYDLRIGTIFKDNKIFSKDHPNDSISFIEVKPSEIVTMLTLEVVNIPNKYVGTVFAINRMSSKGLLILNPGHIDPGFKGPVSICAINLSKESFKLNLGDSIFTLVVNELKKELEEKDLYNPSYDKTKRKEYEKSYDKNSFSRLSKSFFDLIVGYEKAKELLISRLYDRLKLKLKKIGSFLIWVTAILGGIYLIFPSSSLFVNKSKLEKDYQIEISERDSIINSKDIIIEAKDSIIVTKELELSKFKEKKNKPKDGKN